MWAQGGGPLPAAVFHYPGNETLLPATGLISSTADEAQSCLHLLPVSLLSACAMFEPPSKTASQASVTFRIREMLRIGRHFPVTAIKVSIFQLNWDVRSSQELVFFVVFAVSLTALHWAVHSHKLFYLLLESGWHLPQLFNHYYRLRLLVNQFLCRSHIEILSLHYILIFLCRFVCVCF